MDELSVVLEAREFVNKAAVTGFPVSVKAYADQIGAIIHIDNQLAPDELGCSTLIKGKHHIGVNGNDDETRRRFHRVPRNRAYRPGAPVRAPITAVVELRQAVTERNLVRCVRIRTAAALRF